MTFVEFTLGQAEVRVLINPESVSAILPSQEPDHETVPTMLVVDGSEFRVKESIQEAVRKLTEKTP
jgi:uncharacterized protein YlzI (FlbEa/FlbD family)